MKVTRSMVSLYRRPAGRARHERYGNDQKNADRDHQDVRVTRRGNETWKMIGGACIKCLAQVVLHLNASYAALEHLAPCNASSGAFGRPWVHTRKCRFHHTCDLPSTTEMHSLAEPVFTWSFLLSRWTMYFIWILLTRRRRLPCMQ